MIDASFLNQLDRFNILIRKRVNSNYTGARFSVAHGRGIVIKDHRIYTPGDDFRAIDWKVYARTDKLHIKKYEEERNLSVHIILDASSSMDFGKPTTKFEYSAMLALGFAYLALKNNEKIQYCTFNETMNLFRPRRGVSQILGMLDHFNSMKPAGVSKMQESIEKYKKTVKNKSYIVIFSDFLIDIAEIKKALMRLSAGEHEVVAVQVLDKSEINLKLEGDLRLHDSETRSVMRTFMTERMKQEYKDKLKMHIMAVEKECDLLGIRFKLVSTNVPLFDVFYDLFVFKK